MAVTKSAQKALRQNKRRRARNLHKMKEMKNTIKELKVLLSEKKTEEAKVFLAKIYKALDKAAKSGLIKKGSASRKKSRLAKALLKAR